MLGVGNNRVADHKTFVVESSDGFELSEDNKFVETNGTHETNTEPSNKDGKLEEAEAVQAAIAVATVIRGIGGGGVDICL